MVATGDFRPQADLRKRRRKTLQYPAWILTGPGDAPRKCMLSDISDTGARVTGLGEDDLPQEFVLLLAKDGSTRRRCRQVWRNDGRVGVEFQKASPAPTRRRPPPR
jgi:hypothetical protein